MEADEATKPLDTGQDDPPPASIPLSPSYPLRTRLSNTARAWLLCIANVPGITLRGPKLPSPKARRPTIIKTYSTGPLIETHIFIPGPESSRPGALPLYIDVHGGGFMRGSPADDDSFCAQLADRHGICVVAVGYRKAPRWLFPTAVYDVVKTTLAVIESDALPIDRSRVAIGGFSTGASIALSAVQTDELKGRVHGVVAFSPITNWVLPVVKEKLESVKGSDQPDRIGVKLWKLMQWGYLPPGMELGDPILSPSFAAREAIPPHVFIVGAENDMLCAEAEKMAVKLAASEIGKRRGNENAWEKGTERWEKMMGWRHGFHHIVELGDREKQRQQAVERLFDRVGRWLWDTVYI